MTPDQRTRLQDIATERPLAQLPTAEDIRLLLAEVDRLELALVRVDSALDNALWAASDAAFAHATQVRRES